MTNERSFALVFGYLPEIDDVYEPAQRLGLNQRFAVALDSYRAGHGQMYYDHECLYFVIEALAPVIACDQLLIKGVGTVRNVPAGTLRPADLVVADDDTPEDQSPFAELLMVQNDAVVCLVHYEGWYVATGGPFPYHDTHAFSFYTMDVSMAEVLQKITEAAAQANLAIRDVLHGRTDPHISFLTKLKRLF